MTRSILIGMGVLALASCNPWDNLPQNGNNSWSHSLWDANVTSTLTSLYVRLPGEELNPADDDDGDTGWYDYGYYSESARTVGQLLRLDDSGKAGTVETVDLGGAAATRIEVAPDGATFLVFSRLPGCDTNDEDIETLEECVEEGETVEWKSEVHLVRGETVEKTWDLPPHLNAISFSADSAHAVAFMDASQPAEVGTGGLANVSAVQFINLANPQDELKSVNIGYGVERVLFTEGNTKAVVLSESEVVVVDMNDDYRPTITYHLALDVDDEITPKDADLTPDGTTAFLTVEGGGDLYALDLVAESINIVDLDASPADMVVNDAADRTALVYSSRAQVDLVDHNLMEVETITLDEPANEMIEFQQSGSVLLFNTGGYKDVYKVDLVTSEVQEWRLKSPPTRVVVTSDETRAVVFTEPSGGSGNYGVEILDLTSESGGATNLESQSQPLDLALTETHALVLLAGVSDLLQVRLADGFTQAVELEDTPLGIGNFGSSDFWITHDAALGLVTFYDPATAELVSIGGFATAGLFQDETPLPGQEN
jgi:hypothetical protein